MNSNGRALLDSAMTEKVFQQAIIDLAHACRWKTYHTHDSRRSAPGFPDLVLVKPGRHCLFWEVKTERGQVSVAQQAWIDDLRNSGQIAVVVRPHNWPWIEQILTGRVFADQLTGRIA
jgi:hypothetical protein